MCNIYQSRLKTHSGNAREKKYGQVELNLSPAIYSQMQVDRLCAVKNVLFKAASKTIDNAFHRVVYILQPKINNNLLRYISCYIAENRFTLGQCCSTGQVGNFLRKDDSCDRTLVIYRTVHCTVFIFMPGDDTNYAAGWVPQSMVHVLRSLGMICDFFYPFLSLHSKQSTFRDHDLQMHLKHTCSHVMVNMFVICRCKLTAWDGLYHDFWER